MKLETRYQPGDEVFHVFQGYVRQEERCPFCQGTRKVSGANGERIPCPKCDGQGRILREAPGPWKTTGPHVVRALHVRFEADDTTIVYVMVGLGNSTLFFEHDLYPSLEEVAAEANFRNQFTTPVVGEA